MMSYLNKTPDAVPSGKVLVHNHVRPAKRIGTRGFRAWLDEPSDHYEPCTCGWAPHLPEHYRVISGFLSSNGHERLRLVFGAKAIAEFLDQPVRRVHHLLEIGQLPAQKVGGFWVARCDQLAARFTVPEVAQK